MDGHRKRGRGEKREKPNQNKTAYAKIPKKEKPKNGPIHKPTSRRSAKGRGRKPKGTDEKQPKEKVSYRSSQGYLGRRSKEKHQNMQEGEEEKKTETCNTERRKSAQRELQ